MDQVEALYAMAAMTLGALVAGSNPVAPIDFSEIKGPTRSPKRSPAHFWAATNRFTSCHRISSHQPGSHGVRWPHSTSRSNNWLTAGSLDSRPVSLVGTIRACLVGRKLAMPMLVARAAARGSAVGHMPDVAC